MTIAARIARESAGNVRYCGAALDPTAMASLLLKVAGPGKLNNVGIREPGVWALLSVPVFPCSVEGGGGAGRCAETLMYVEITRIECDEHGKGLMLASACRCMGRCLVMGCVEGARMRELMRRHGCAWHRLASDRTSFAYAPSVACLAREVRC